MHNRHPLPSPYMRGSSRGVAVTGLRRAGQLCSLSQSAVVLVIVNRQTDSPTLVVIYDLKEFI